MPAKEIRRKEKRDYRLGEMSTGGERKEGELRTVKTKEEKEEE